MRPVQNKKEPTVQVAHQTKDLMHQNIHPDQKLGVYCQNSIFTLLASAVTMIQVFEEMAGGATVFRLQEK